MDHPIVHFEIAADDPEALAEFYSELLGWKFEEMPGGQTKYWGIETGGEGPMGGMMERQSPEQSVLNYVNVESVDDYAAKAEELGGQVVMGKTQVQGMGWFAVVVDPQGNAFGIWENMEEGECSGCGCSDE